jgi:tetraacyldisaccharide 4'-kinase
MRWGLVPFSLLFSIFSALRRWAFRHGLLRAERMPVPVIVVGNITAGGTGKTPLSILLLQWLRAAGYRPGVVSRGYGGKARGAMPVRPDSDPGQVGDEPVLIARRTGCPVWIGRRRAEAGRQLLSFHPEVDVLISDDGLQHYALARDLEITVVDGPRGFGNGWLLPAGPLREPVKRLEGLAAIVLNGAARVGLALPGAVPRFAMTLEGQRFVNVRNPERTATAEDFQGQPVAALAGIGNPERFFEYLGRLGLTVTAIAFPDHHVFRAADLPGGRVVMTEKDAVKCAPLVRELALDEVWYLEVDAEVEAGLKTLVLRFLNSRKARHGPQAA